MDILIKSFNRPYFLERCIITILKHVKNYENIIVLDDGTPQKYLDKLTEKYPEIIIKKSEYYSNKSEMILSGRVKRKELSFPGAFWERESANTNGEFVVILEDDMFFVDSINLDHINSEMVKNNLILFKMMWQQNQNLIYGHLVKEIDYRILFPKIVTANTMVYSILTNDRFKILSILSKLGIWSFFYKKYMVKYYSLYSVAGCIFNKEYFSYIWKDINKLDESIQIKKTLNYYKKYKIDLKVGVTETEILKTSLISSATNEFKDIPFDVFNFNFVLNELWSQNKLDVMNNYPLDWSDQYVKTSLHSHGWAKERIQIWQDYKNKFTSIYQKVGSSI